MGNKDIRDTTSQTNTSPANDPERQERRETQVATNGFTPDRIDPSRDVREDPRKTNTTAQP
jgi:hypothetical protein